ncbi:TPA: hypothetical protein ACGJWA_000137 [Pseudomonas aeruginosa]|uniref:DUF7079 family protein n=1 Tax=Pseudomonas aeruginosa TaxID=287 RepID=UPI000AB7BE54|nr:hypothetical protein [Pseudomonas aeruginosa]HBO1237664.1 hypothetical protein [Pseudomonas aeruginosa]HBO1242815.1 hypothetical protein [Pseudomonas aeruginosa]HBO1876832.1 hypothetical protein [Pseudomonas aeruginosa]HBO1881925.1 hypothetical protein [Pseudomonas aeruginosa]HBO2081358.1 hypothetical protein [Pseudomonas aeruginosa]
MALDPSQRRRLRHALSDAFVDTLLEPEDIARRIKGVDPALLERLFFEEVAPVCHGNLLSPAPAVWTAFDEAWLEEAIERRLARQRSSALRRWHEPLPGRLAAMAIRRHLARDRRRSLSERLSEIPNG